MFAKRRSRISIGELDMECHGCFVKLARFFMLMYETSDADERSIQEGDEQEQKNSSEQPFHDGNKLTDLASLVHTIVLRREENIGGGGQKDQHRQKRAKKNVFGFHKKSSFPINFLNFKL